jgi:hypothetical protein
MQASGRKVPRALTGTETWQKPEMSSCLGGTGRKVPRALTGTETLGLSGHHNRRDLLVEKSLEPSRALKLTDVVHLDADAIVDE